jgi:hypothetical protein
LPSLLYPWQKTKNVRDHVKLDPTDRNPDLDISPPKKYIIQLGTKRPEGAVENEEMAHIYQPDGRCVGTVSKQCLHMLQSQYEHAKATNPGEHMDLAATTFPQDVAKLILR